MRRERRGQDVMRIMILGASGLLGQAVVGEAVRRGHAPLAASRNAADCPLDLTDLTSLDDALARHAPDIVINCAALTDIQACEDDPGAAWRINARPLATLAAWSTRHRRPLVHVSTDHYFPTGDDRAHAEDSTVTLINEYARSKFAGEALALSAPGALVLRTSIVGIRGWTRPSFAEWVLDAVEADAPMTLFCDAYTSSIDVPTMARALFDLLAAGQCGLLNLAAREVYSKEQFIRETARQLGQPLSQATSGSVGALNPPRPQCLGLDVRRAEAILGYALPDLTAVVSSILNQREERRRDDAL